ncbi:MAG TPA: tRNA (N(6)-L-threonylcarbamoyladenosine(37)-C(2))-methylthiotransferase MtaB [Nitrospiria bacterium]|nr:tRNA (N(6)-L-threonylcarbamoyladenosine(37)-C(2))-methylthiotransferase MtaB [Nitrospiria bacterium]
MKIAFATLGCKVNQFDTLVMKQGVSRQELEVVPFEEKADLYVINTCTVTDNADAESRYWIRKAKKANPAAKIVVTGCYAQTNPDEVRKIPGVNMVVGNEEKKEIGALLTPLLGAEPAEPLYCVGEIGREKQFKQPLLENCPDRTRAFLKIQDGCNSWCTFCIIPKARGRSRSMDPAEVIEQILIFEGMGYREAVLSGINLGAYGLDLRPKNSLLALFLKMAEETSKIRFRFSSIEPDLFTPELVETLAQSERVCRHFHIPLQSGSERTLNRMNRKYSPDAYRGLILALHRLSPDASLGADVMVGFPGETEEEFKETSDLIDSLPLSYLHVFPFSAREGTDASHFENHLPLDRIQQRASALREKGREKETAFMRKFIGKELKALVERRPEELMPQFGMALTDNYLRILIENGQNTPQNSEIVIVAKAIKKNKLIGKSMGFPALSLGNPL